MENNKSVAVGSFGIERARQGSGDPLNEGLKGTFPASDPIFATTKAIPSMAGRSRSSSDTPRVDEALESILEHRSDPYVEPREQISALRDEVESLRYRLADGTRTRIRAQPLQAVGLAAVVGFIFGLTR